MRGDTADIVECRARLNENIQKAVSLCVRSSNTHGLEHAGQAGSRGDTGVD